MIDLSWVQEEWDFILGNPDIGVGIIVGVGVILVLWSIGVSTIHIRRW